MAKTFISNNNDFTKNTKNNALSVGFLEYNDFYLEHHSIIVFNKLKVKNFNFLQWDNNYIAVSGTFIYRGFNGKKGLELLYHDFVDEIESIREFLIGNYMITIKKDHTLYIFGDENNIFNINYYMKDNIWIVSNALYDIYKQVQETVEINEMNLIEEVFQNAIIDNGTIFSDILKLMGSEYIKIDLLQNSMHIQKIDQHTVDIQSPTVTDLAVIIKKNIKDIATNFNHTTINMTGGLDSRIVLASYMSVNIKPSIVYGIGNSYLTNTKNNDLVINKIYQEKFNLDFTTMHWYTDKEFKKGWEYYQNKYGFYSRIYGGSKHVFESFENLNNTEFVDFGYFGESLRNIDWLETLNQDHFSLDMYLDDFYIRKELKDILSEASYLKYRTHIYNKLLYICNRYILDPKQISKNNFQKLHNEYRKSADNIMLNFINYNFYSINLLSINEIEKYILNIPFVDKRKSKFIIQLLEHLYPDILDIPIFSHTEMYRLNKKTLLLEVEVKYRFLKKLKNLLKKIIIHKKLLQTIKSSYQNISDNDISMDEILLFCHKELKTNQAGISALKHENFHGDIRYLFKYIYLMDMLNQNKKV